MHDVIGDRDNLRPRAELFYLELEETLNTILLSPGMQMWFNRDVDKGPGSFYASEAGKFMRDSVGADQFDNPYAMRLSLGIDWVKITETQSVGIIVLQTLRWASQPRHWVRFALLPLTPPQQGLYPPNKYKLLAAAKASIQAGKSMVTLAPWNCLHVTNDMMDAAVSCSMEEQPPLYFRAVDQIYDRHELEEQFSMRATKYGEGARV
ncbi:hypothetical protein QJQ45_013939 [Haematococcus lacustris]|nr:hypothetical protein QJQ45_013939 [Haematococcus lacustris]